MFTQVGTDTKQMIQGLQILIHEGGKGMVDLTRGPVDTPAQTCRQDGYCEVDEDNFSSEAQARAPGLWRYRFDPYEEAWLHIMLSWWHRFLFRND